MSKVINFSEATEMKNAPVLNIEKGVSFTIKTDYYNVPDLVEASEKYGVEFPQVTYVVNCRKQEDGYMCEFFCGFEDYGNMYYQFGIVENWAVDELEDLAVNMVINNFDNMCWEEPIKVHLAEYGIDYEEDNEYQYHCGCSDEIDIEMLKEELPLDPILDFECADYSDREIEKEQPYIAGGITVPF